MWAKTRMRDNEGQSHKTLAYVQALQYWAEKASPSMPDLPCLLVGSIQELRVGSGTLCNLYHDAVLEGTAPQRGPPVGLPLAPNPMETPSTPVLEELDGTKVPDSRDALAPPETE